MSVCSGIKPSGERCKASVLKGEQYCWFHSPNRSQARREVSSRGGEAPPAGTGSGAARQLRDRLGILYAEIREGAVGPKVGAVLIQATGAQLRAVQLEAELAHGDEMLERLNRLEAVASERVGGAST